MTQYHGVSGGFLQHERRCREAVDAGSFIGMRVRIILYIIIIIYVRRGELSPLLENGKALVLLSHVQPSLTQLGP